MTNFANIIVIICLILCVGGAVYFLYSQWKKGQKCFGCPYAGSCNMSCDEERKKSDKGKENE